MSMKRDFADGSEDEFSEEDQEFEEVFNMIDTQRKGSIDSKEFVYGIKNQLSLWMNEHDCECLLLFLDKDQQGTLEFEEFDEKINSMNVSIR